MFIIIITFLTIFVLNYIFWVLKTKTFCFTLGYFFNMDIMCCDVMSLYVWSKSLDFRLFKCILFIHIYFFFWIFFDKLKINGLFKKNIYIYYLHKTINLIYLRYFLVFCSVTFINFIKLIYKLYQLYYQNCPII
jgi:hypothetical protein